MFTNWSVTPSIRDNILKKSNLKGVWNRTMTIMVASVTLSLVCIFAFLHLSTWSMEDNITLSLLHREHTASTARISAKNPMAR